MRSSSRISADRTIRLFFWIVIIFSAVAVYLYQNPHSWSNADKAVNGAQIKLDAVSDFAILIDYGNMPKVPKSFADADFSLAWINTVQQEVGPVAVYDASAFADLDLNKHRFLICTRSASSEPSWLPKLKNYVDRGGTLILEMPSGAVREAFSADGKGGLRTPQNFTHAKGLDKNYDAHLARFDLSKRTQIIGSAGPFEDSETFLTIDGVPVIYGKRFGRGSALTFDMDFGKLLTSVQQGRPEDDFQLRDFDGSGTTETSDLALQDPELYASPIADIIERFVIYGVFENNTPVVTFWPFFDGHDGAFIVMHNENRMGDASTWMSDFEKTFKASSTYFITVPTTFTNHGFEKLNDNKSEIALQWHLDPQKSLSFERGGVLLLPFFKHVLNLSEQTDALKEAQDNPHALLSAQSANFYWTKSWTLPFGILSSNAFVADASYANPTPLNGFGFGTGFPFMPLAQDGLIYNILEFPITISSLANEEDSELLKNFFKESQISSHQVFSVVFRPNFFAEKPDVEAFLAWRKAYESAIEHKQWVTGIRHFYRFSRARHNSEIKSKITEMTVNQKKVTVVRVEVLAVENGMSLTFPHSIQEKNFVEARRGLNRVQEDTLLNDVLKARFLSVFGYQRVLIPLSKGFNAIDAVYE